MPEILTLNGVDVPLGASAKISLSIARLPTYTSINLPVHVYRGKKDGPVVMLTGGLHGDEINGIEIIRKESN